MNNPKNQTQGDAERVRLRAENAALRVALRQAQDFCVGKEQKSIEYIFHLGQYKSRLLSRLDAWVGNFFGAAPKSDQTPEMTPAEAKAHYTDWLAQFDAIEGGRIAKHIEQFVNAPRFTLLLDCRGADRGAIDASLKSLGEQFYQNFDLLICGEAHLLEALSPATMTRFDYYKKLIPLAASSTTKQLFLKASHEITGDFVAVMRAGDRLHQTAFYECAAELDLYPQTQALYTDEDALDAFGDRIEPCFKPDWNVELFLGQNYVGGFCFISRERFCAFAAKNHIETLEAVNFYALLDAPRETVRHIPAVLYHRHAAQQKDVWTGRSQALAQSYLDAQGIKAEAGALAAHPDWIEVQRKALDPSPLVTIIIPTRNRPDLLSVCLRGVLNETHYKNVEVIIVDHENDHPGVLEIFTSYANDARITVLPYRGVFDHSDMNNRAAQIARGDILLFLNDDIEVIEPDWLTHMVAQFAQVDRGVVGARLLYPSRRIQHAGVILGFGGVAGHGFVGLGANDPGYFGRLTLASEVSALTGACMAMRRALFEEVGGFSARHLQRTFNDVDLCLKARAKGKVNIYTPLATLIHHESATDGGDVKLKQYKRLQGEVGYMLETWGLMRSDPYYNVNLALEGESFSLAFPPRRVAPWQAVGIS